MIAWSAIVAAWLAGVMGGVHCLAMCGGFAAALSGSRGTSPLRSARELACDQLAANLGRVATYTALGALAGGVGGTLMSAAQWLPLQRALYVLANVALAGLALTIAFRREPFTGLQRITARLFVRVAPALGALARGRGTLSRMASGVLWGLVPCAMIYSVLPVALLSGGATQGALVMLAFGVGTLPNLAAAGWIVAQGRRWRDRAAVRMITACVLASFAGIGIWRALADSAVLAATPFCLVH
ncbi:MAG TPA: sulfite exporter TauE/SafE family protein [Casimicrobiaceae bacterium]|nr:sulfite exporter TauE/SafE family protein [Casimicrobiaceae bacterium]